MSLWPAPPTIVLSSRCSRLTPPRTLAAVADRAGLPGLDLDLDGRAFPALGRTGAPEPDRLGRGRIDALWLPRFSARADIGERRDRLLEGWALASTALGVRHVMVDREIALRPVGSRNSQPVLMRLRQTMPPAATVVVVLRSGALEGSRPHLNGLITLRRMAEEWDFGLALDLTGPIDHRWEAEAAIQRLLPRLVLVRLPTVVPARNRTGASRMTNRVVAYLLDQGYGGTVSVTPRLLPGEFLRPDRIVTRARAEALAITSRHQRLYASARAVSPMPYPEETPSTDRNKAP